MSARASFPTKTLGIARIGSVAGVLFALSPPSAAQDAPPLFSHEIHKTTGTPSLAPGDFDEDGHPDLAVLDGQAFVRLYRGTGLAWFQSLGSLPIPNTNHCMAIGDLSGDGHEDLVLLSSFLPIPKITVYTGDGHAAFTQALQYPLGQGAGDVRLADLDNDGDLDVAYADVIVPFVTTLLATPFPAFGPALLTPTAAMNPGIVGATDADQDGTLDLIDVSTNSGGGTIFFQVKKGVGDGTFSTVLSSGSVADYRTVRLGDVTGDGKLDMVALTAASGSYKYRSYVMGANGVLALASTGNLAHPPGRLALADVTGDGLVDSIMAAESEQWLQVLAGDGAGNFASLGSQAIATPFRSLLPLDANADGALDLVSGVQIGQPSLVLGFVVFPGNGSGAFASPPPPLSTGGYLWGLAVADLDHDGILDLIHTNGASTLPTQQFLKIQLGQGALAYGPEASTPLAAGSQRLAIGDFNQDGNPDVVVNHTNSSTILPGVGDGTFQPPYEVATILNSAPEWAIVGDFDGNATADLLLNFQSPSVIAFIANNAVGGFAPVLTYPTAQGPVGLAVADLDLDGDLDAIATSNLTQTIHLGDGAGGFSRIDIATPQLFTYPQSVAIGDFGGDGIPDFAIGTLGDQLVPFTGQGGGSFVAGNVLTTVSGSTKMVATDIDRDGRCDLIASSKSPAIVSLYLGPWTTTLPAPKLHFGIGDFVDLAVADLDADGNPDAAAASQSAWSIFLFRNLLGATPGTSTYGTGTIGCQGKHGISVKDVPAVGNPNFGITSTNAPPNALGLGAYASYPDVAGTDLFQIGLAVHLDFATSPIVGLFDLHSDGGGNGFGPLPIPNFPWLVGSTYYFQVYWVFGPSEGCHPSPIGFSSSPGMAVTIQ